MNNTSKLTFPALFQESLRNNKDQVFLSFVGEEPYTYKTAHNKILSVISFLEDLGINPGDKVAILSTNMPNWGIVYLATTFIGAVAVPILPDFQSTEIKNVLKHSGTNALFVSHGLIKKLDDDAKEQVKNIVRIDDFSVISSENLKVAFNPEAKPKNDYQVEEENLASIIYTSGTTGKSKGVMLTHKNIAYTAIATQDIQPVNRNDRFLSILPLSHTYENTLGFIIPMTSGASVYYMRKPPTASALLPALKKVKPTMMLSVPLVIEKIYKTKILPQFQRTWYLRLLYKVPFFRKTFNQMAGKKLLNTFGGKIKFFGIGGAKLDKVVERFLSEAKFPYSIGYGLTETSPLLAGANPSLTRLHSTGPAMKGVSIKIHDPDPKTGEGEIWVKGPNIMKGYYKEPELTKEAFSEDGWFKTGDLGVFDKDNFLYIKGRLKNMIVGNNGENIYPEEIESVINNFRNVVESLVVEKKGKLVAMVHINKEDIEKRYHQFKEGFTLMVEKKVEEWRNELHDYINSRVNRFSKVQKVEVHSTPFEKTATQKIKRFLYTHNNKHN
jgi:long-chain acyl-CoA synthetase